jgi:hypothetical protein
MWLTIGRNRVRTSVGIPGTGFGWYEERPTAARFNAILWILGIGFLVLGVAVAFLWH